MAVTATNLRELHRIHRQLSDLNSRAERGPKQIRAAEANVAKAQEAVDVAKQAVIRNKVATDEKDLQLRERENRIADIKTKLNGASSNREYQAFLEQIAADDQANSVLSDEILELMEKTSELEAAVAESEADLDKCSADLNAVKEKVESERESLQFDIDRLKKELVEAESILPLDFKRDYDRIVQKKGEDALARVEEGDVCGGCFQMITPQNLTELAMQRPLFCKSCGCLLYLPE